MWVRTASERASCPCKVASWCASFVLPATPKQSPLHQQPLFLMTFSTLYTTSARPSLPSLPDLSHTPFITGTVFYLYLSVTPPPRSPLNSSLGYDFLAASSRAGCCFHYELPFSSQGFIDRHFYPFVNG